MKNELKRFNSFNHNRYRKKLKSMTVCIATICEYNLAPKIVFCADRLVTDSNGLTFEQGVPKIDYIDENCLVMSAGLAAESDEIIQIIKKKVLQKLEETGMQRLNIRDIAILMKEEHQKIRTEKIEDEILKPRGLTIKSFYDKIKNFPEWLGILLDTNVGNYDFGVNFLVFGFDVSTETGIIIPQLYKIDEKGELHILNKVGFGIIGIGEIMSLPEITEETYSPNNPLSDAILRTYWAKRSSERVVSVGSKTTDIGMMWIETKNNVLQIKNTLFSDDFKRDVLQKEFDENSKKVKDSKTEIQKNLHSIFIGEKSIQPKN